jgi:hypothetical protein
MKIKDEQLEFTVILTKTEVKKLIIGNSLIVYHYPLFNPKYDYVLQIKECKCKKVKK